MLDYAALSALAAVVREGSFERAARALHVTPSAVSQRIRQLEERVGCALVVRGQPCHATEVGQRLCRHVDQVRLMEHELREVLPVAAVDPLAPRLRRVTLPVAVNADSLATWFAPAAARFAAEAPVLLEVAVDDQDHTAERLRSGAVLAAVTAMAAPAAGCNSRPLGAMRYVATASPAFVARHFSADGVNARTLAEAPSLIFDRKDQLQARWVRRQCRRAVELPRHALPSTQAFIEASLAGMGWGMQPEALVRPLLDSGALVELVSGATLDVRLYWQHARAASSLLEGLTSAVLAGARAALH
ncbi:LysR family transcriptional regulator ArgP [Xenophilus sp. Marseille-Q4582]|uniref:LysR family transcriptional regulator ArgP n=1 Tax=Xenophilus sp. Marseille-Q4582 TaxID=2866600 RepID=UPI001CE4114B|nr:LysR family transcriptional regulator ArgP [Xenophilus sp. Marseille-Q4582]